MSDPINLTVQALTFPLDMQVVGIVIPISTGTVDQALIAIRGDVPSDRDTLGKMSDALDAGDAATLRTAKFYARRTAIVLGGL